MAADHTNPQAGAGRPLPKKEGDLFKNVVKHYEMKQYKKAIKQAEAILKKFPNHGETLAMKGLTLNQLSKKEEAHALVKEGLRNDMRSHVCWHVYGLLYRSDHDYIEAIKAYKQALRIDPENLQILRDLSMLQIQMRDLDGFAITRNTLLSLKPNAKINWMAFALARHLTGDLQGEVKVIDIYLGTLSEGSAELGRCYESSELALYKNSILAEVPNNYKEALDHLGVCEGIVVDRGAWLLKRMEYQVKLRDFIAARQSALLLFKYGMTENYTVHSLYICALLEMPGEICDKALRLIGTTTIASVVKLSTEQKALVRGAYTVDLAPLFPQSQAIQRIPLVLLEGDDLRQALDKRCRKDLSRGVPSLCSELSSYLWTEKDGAFVRTVDPVDVKEHPLFQIFAEMADGYVSNLLSVSKFAPEDEEEESPSTALWALFLRAGLHELAGEYREGLDLLEKGLDHTPTAVDVFEVKARMLKLSGDIHGAAECIDQGRDLDRQDRYINNLTTRYLLQAGKEEEALKRIAMFTRHEGNPEQNLYDMQCSWYELELAACLARRELWGRSLKKYAAVVKHFEDFNEDQFDFHSYCLRKVTLRAYVSVLRFEDEIYGQEYYCEAASGMIRIYLRLFDSPDRDDGDEPDYSKMTPAERKKAKAIVRKKRKALEKKEAELKEKEGENGTKTKNQKGGKPSFVEEDPLGRELLKKDPIEEAKRLSATLARYAPNRLETWLIEYDVAMRRKKALMALRALFKARSIELASSELFTRIVDFAGKVDGFTELSDQVSLVLKDEFPKLLDGKAIGDYVNDRAAALRSTLKGDLRMRTAVSKALVEMKLCPISEAADLIVNGGIAGRNVSVDSCRDALSALQSFGDEASQATESWTVCVQGRFAKAI